MRRCPYCNKIMIPGLRWSRSRRRLQIIFKCDECWIWRFPKKRK